MKDQPLKGVNKFKNKFLIMLTENEEKNYLIDISTKIKNISKHFFDNIKQQIF